MVESAVRCYGHLIHRILNVIVIVKIYFKVIIQAAHIHSGCVNVGKLVVVLVAVVVTVCRLDQGPELKIWAYISARIQWIIRQETLIYYFRPPKECNSSTVSRFSTLSLINYR